MVGAAAKRDAVAHLKAVMGLSERRACQIISADRKTMRYQSCRPPEAELRMKLRGLANQRRRFGYQRLFIVLRREGEPSGVNRIYRLYREEGLSVRKRKARRRAVGTRAPILVEAKANARWSLDFVHDQFACGRRFRILNVVNDVTRECLAAIPDTSISSGRVARELTTLIERRGKPGMIVSDNGNELTSNAILAWSKDHKGEWHYIAPEDQCKRVMSRVSTAACVTSCSTRACSSVSTMPSAPLQNGPTITIISGHTHRSDTRPRRIMPRSSPQPAPTLCNVEASRFRRLLPPRHLA